jgi:hypothetical protein
MWYKYLFQSKAGFLGSLEFAYEIEGDFDAKKNKLFI